MQEAKTQKNRKSLLNQNTSPKPAMKDKMTPNKSPNQQVKGAKSPFKKTGVSPKTPRDNGVEGDKTPNMSNKKRKSIQPNLLEKDDLSPKKPKVDIFATVSKMITSASADASPAATTKVEGNNPQFDSLTRSQRKRLKAKLKRKSHKTKQQEMIEKLKENDPSAQVMIKEVAEKIAAIKQRPLTATSRRKLRDLNKLLRTAEGKDAVVNTGAGKTPKKDFNKGKPQNQVQGTNKGNKNMNDVQKSKVVKNKVEKTQQMKKKVTVSKPPLAPKDDDEESDAESDYDVEGSIKIPAKEAVNTLEEDDDDDEDDDDVAEEEDEAASDAGDDSDDEQSDEENNVGESSEEESDEVLEGENGDDAPPGKPVINKKVQNSSKPTRTGNTDNKSFANSKKEKAQSIEGAGIVQKGQSRYVLYVNNLPYDSEKQEIVDHFAKIGAVKDVRIPTDMKTKKPRGFAYVEVNDQETYEKALSLHHTILKGRRINVLYTLGGKKKGEDKKKEIKVKNFKLNAMRQQGMLAGSVKDTQKRSARRAKKNNMEKSSE